MLRIGHGIDIHAFNNKGILIIGGIKIPYHKGLLAHSDGDVLLHSITDALLGASALGDIGKFYPDTNLSIKGIDSSIILCEIWNKIKNKGYILNNIDSTIILQKPKINLYINKIKLNIAKLINIKINQISIKATTTEKLGFVGRREGIICETIVLLVLQK